VEVVLGVKAEIDDVVAEGFHSCEAAGLGGAGGVWGAHIGGD